MDGKVYVLVNAMDGIDGVYTESRAKDEFKNRLDDLLGDNAEGFYDDKGRSYDVCIKELEFSSAYHNFYMRVESWNVID